MIWAIVQLSTKETQFFCVMKIIDGGVLPEFPIEEFVRAYKTPAFYQDFRAPGCANNTFLFPFLHKKFSDLESGFLQRVFSE